MSIVFQLRQITDKLFDVICADCDCNYGRDSTNCEENCIVPDLRKDYNKLITEDIKRDDV